MIVVVLLRNICHFQFLMTFWLILSILIISLQTLILKAIGLHSRKQLKLFLQETAARDQSEFNHVVTVSEEHTKKIIQLLLARNEFPRVLMF